MKGGDDDEVDTDSSELTESEDDAQPLPPPTSRQTLQAACSSLPPSLVRVSETRSAMRSAVLNVDGGVPPRSRVRFEITDLVSSALESVQDAIIGIAPSASAADASARRKEVWESLSGPPASAARLLTRDKPAMPDLASSQSLVTNSSFRSPLQPEADLAMGAGAIKHTTVSIESLKTQESLLREVMLLHSSVDSYLSLLRRLHPNPTPEHNAMWLETSRALWSASLQTGKALGNTIVQRREAILAGVSGFQSCTDSQRGALRAAPLDGQHLFGGLFHTFCDRMNRNPALMAFGKTSGPSSGGTRGVKRRKSGKISASNKRPRVEQPAHPQPRTQPRPQQQAPSAAGGPRGGRRSERKRGGFSRGARGGNRH